MKEISIIIVNYNTKDFLKNCLNSIIENTEAVDYEVIVVDNASSDESLEMLRNDFPQVLLICNKENVGFARANNQGIRIAKGENILFLNSDTVVSKNCLFETLRFVRSRPEIGIVGCKVLNEDKGLQYSCYHAPTLLSELVFFTKEVVKNLWEPFTYYKYMKYWDHSQIKEVDCIAGCFLWVKRELFDKGGLLDESFFMYYEDAEFCYRVRRNSNFKVYYYPRAEIIHLKGKSGDWTNFETLKHCYRSARYYLKKCYGVASSVLLNILCKCIWKIEILFFLTLFRFHRNTDKKLTMLKELSRL